MANNSTIEDFYKLVNQWLDQAAKSREKAALENKRSPMALYERLSADTLENAAGELRAVLETAQPGESMEQLIPRLQALYQHWQAKSDEARLASTKSSLDGARHVGTALGLEKIMDQFKPYVQDSDKSPSSG